MRKINLMALALILIFAMSGCQGKVIVPKGEYKDGVYDEKQKSEGPGYEEAIVTVKNGFISNVELKKLDDNQKEVNYDEWDGTKEGKPNLKKVRSDFGKMMVAKQSADIDTVSGATQSCKGWKTAVSKALTK